MLFRFGIKNSILPSELKTPTNRLSFYKVYKDDKEIKNVWNLKV